MAKVTERQAISILKHLPAYSVIFGWNRSKLARAMMRWFLAPAEDDLSRTAHSRRAFVSTYRLDELSRKKTIINNMEPFCEMIQNSVTFDRLIEFSIELGIDPFEELPKHINSLDRGVFGQWVGGLSAPILHIQNAIDRFFQERLSIKHHVFMNTPDFRLIELGYFSDQK